MKTKRWLSWALCALALLLFFVAPYVLPMASTPATDVAPGTLEIHVIDVGQGDAVLLRTAEHAILVDCGTNDSEQDLSDYLSRLRQASLDALIVSHPHEDHMGGADMILRELAVDTLLLPDVAPQEDVGAQLSAAYAQSDASARLICAGEVLEYGALSLLVLSPPSGGFEQMNDNSLLLRVSYGETTVLLCGDAEAAVEEYLLQSYDAALLDCDLLKAGHHGSDTSSSKAFLAATTPQYVAISCGRGNSYGHPAQSALDRAAAVGAKISRTDRDGTLVFVSDGLELRLREK